VASASSEILIRTLVPIGVMVAYASLYTLVRNRRKAKLDQSEAAIPLRQMIPSALAGWLKYAGFLASMATFQVFSQSSPPIAYAALVIALCFGLFMLLPVFRRAKEIDNLSRSGSPEYGTKYSLEGAGSPRLEDLLNNWAAEQGFSRHSTSTDKIEVFIKTGACRYVSVTRAGDRVVIEAWVQRGKLAEPIKSGQNFPIPQGKLRKDLNVLFAKLGMSSI
jgi:hypothetical protein